jgi:hypothetical protein
MPADLMNRFLSIVFSFSTMKNYNDTKDKATELE